MQIVNHVDSAAGPAPPPTDPGDSAPRRKIGRFLVAVLALAAIGAVLIGVGGGRHRNPPAPPEPRPSGTTQVPANRLSDRSQTVPTTPPVGIDWRLFAGVVLPYSSAAGPARVSGAVASGFAHTPLGALLAVEQTSPRYAAAPTPGWRAETLAQVLPGVGRDRFVEWRARTPDAAPTGGYAQIAGFRFVTYSPGTAVIQTAYRQPDQGLHVGTETVRWVGGDWRLELQPGGESTPTVQPVATLTGFVPFSGGV
jgi:hypothetical protein